jgi:hypothetical protein
MKAMGIEIKQRAMIAFLLSEGFDKQGNRPIQIGCQ